MKIYLVGGAVRDKLLGLPITEKDWVVVGSSPEEMIQKKFMPVGKDFPVFLHPSTKEEYALARTERKTAKGYQGFSFYCKPDVTLREDLIRRDLTINAIAEDQEGNLIDPYGGKNDLHNKFFRHVSAAFTEDPVRILRVARFACRFTDFTLHSTTQALMKQMVNNGEVDALVAERVWKELSRSLSYQDPSRFFHILDQATCLHKLFPMLNSVCISNLKATSKHCTDPIIRFGALCLTLTQQQLSQLIKTYKVPKDYASVAKLAAMHHQTLNQLDLKNPLNILCFLKSIDAFRRPDRLLHICTASGLGLAQPHYELLNECLSAVKKVDTKPLQDQELKGPAFAVALEGLQAACIENVLKKQLNPRD